MRKFRRFLTGKANSFEHSRLSHIRQAQCDKHGSCSVVNKPNPAGKLTFLGKHYFFWQFLKLRIQIEKTLLRRPGALPAWNKYPPPSAAPGLHQTQNGVFRTQFGWRNYEEPFPLLCTEIYSYSIIYTLPFIRQQCSLPPGVGSHCFLKFFDWH